MSGEERSGGTDSLLTWGDSGTTRREQHLARYTAEFDFRYNTPKISDEDRANANLFSIGGKRLTYRRTDKLAT